MTAPRLVVFDVDGTLVDSQHAILGSMTRAFAAAGHALPPADQALAVVGLSLDEAMAALAPHLPPGETRRIADLYRADFAARRAEDRSEPAPLYPGARAALDRLAAGGALLGIATGKARPGLEHALLAHGIGGLFATTQTADAHPSKPHPSMLRAALAETGIEASRAVMVGDTEFDVRMGRAAGLATVAVAWGYHPRARLEASGPDRVIDAFHELDAALEAVLAAAPASPR